MSTPLPEVIASRIVIPGPDGRPRIEIGLLDGEPTIRMFDADGTVRVRLGLERDPDEDPEYSGLVAEIRLSGGPDDGEAALTAAYGNYAAMDISAMGRAAAVPGAGAWIEAKEGRIEADLRDGPGGTGWHLSRSEVRDRRTGGGLGPVGQPRVPGPPSAETSSS